MVNLIAIEHNAEAKYPKHSPFHPSILYPEYPHSEIDYKAHNYVYDMVRNLLRDLGLDQSNFGKDTWNPLGSIINPGDKILIKPNLVLHDRNIQVLESIITNGSIVRVILDYVFLATKGNAEVVIGDSPMQRAEFEELVMLNGLQEIVNYYSSKSSQFKVSLLDFRKEKIAVGDRSCKAKLQGDPSGYTIVDLGKDSFHSEIDSYYKKYRVTNYDPAVMEEHHSPGKHEYLIANTVLNSDVIINLAKMKTHRKAGVTLSLKNMVGINGSKAYLPHHRIGPLVSGGDEYLVKNRLHSLLSKTIDFGEKNASRNKAKFYKYLSYIVSKFTFISEELLGHPHYREGSWYGNDTIWRTVLDLNRIIFYVDAIGHLHEKPQRKYFGLIDGIIAGEGDGPIRPDSKPCGILVGGFNPALLDWAGSTLMGLNYEAIPLVKQALNSGLFLDDGNIVKTIYNGKEVEKIEPLFYFRASSGWISHIELK